ncbi:hypothetical protein BAUCODRAFT_532495 [Baudoinia panamericana UAMH 10762]|uniref:Uncharacterized protein n=1 Tax=Baudoinia panamericana (strain UAMH 10762) TaxID=717646 RepID=M2LLP9_BAUPA|nr:uncharacterized protein BAUCODRAFT_532495 [Baudoinia panamericana UAMH 10762]EMC95227.1 hypothetical protein BAUCODRAFT_532495 [Baudoinia panamericana UAMH 10762]
MSTGTPLVGNLLLFSDLARRAQSYGVVRGVRSTQGWQRARIDMQALRCQPEWRLLLACGGRVPVRIGLLVMMGTAGYTTNRKFWRSPAVR